MTVGMDEERFIDWYAVVDAVANGRLTGHVCPICAHGPLETSTDGVQVRVRCSNCGEGFEGALGQGRDDALYAEADALQKRQAAARRAAASKSKSAEDHHNSPDSPAASAPVPTATSTPAVRASSPERTRHEPWAWSLPNAGGDDLDALGAWMDVLTAVHNGRRSGLRCPFCSEPLTDVVVQDPHIRLRCTVCGETFEGQVR
jgi:transcription elongation factor Elf1